MQIDLSLHKKSFWKKIHVKRDWNLQNSRLGRKLKDKYGTKIVIIFLVYTGARKQSSSFFLNSNISGTRHSPTAGAQACIAV